MLTKHEEAFGDEKSPLNPLNNPVQFDSQDYSQRNVEVQMPTTEPHQATNGALPMYQPEFVSVQGPTMTKVKGVPVNITCPSCHQSVVTVLKKKNGKKMALAVIGTAAVCWPLAWIPLLVKSLKDDNHVCPSCGMNLGKTIYVQSQAP
ncbi:hypothetical protein BB558_004190 [Smittium angustum]|uniref:LITAF domain-containing protein n=1 Tax=Smittium angustum TaxID=133377 RepID=A0A2U1J3X9_SMIAN|nr:hypothetical protein BB558_004190 [Smittium angustum]